MLKYDAVFLGEPPRDSTSLLVIWILTALVTQTEVLWLVPTHFWFIPFITNGPPSGHCTSSSKNTCLLTRSHFLGVQIGSCMIPLWQLWKSKCLYVVPVVDHPETIFSVWDQTFRKSRHRPSDNHTFKVRAGWKSETREMLRLGNIGNNHGNNHDVSLILWWTLWEHAPSGADSLSGQKMVKRKVGNL